ncbi:hypothetical protein [Enterococcus rivorum]|uniref:hypothetical protein n=1 Tax=Enterococcus rivorum TaxID=762845 RepID=UPI00361F2FD3
MEKKQLQLKIEQQEERIREIKAKDSESNFLIRDLQRVYKQQEAILEEILYYSKGTEAEHSARQLLQQLDEERREAFRTFEHGKEELSELVNESERARDQAEEDLLWLRKKEQEEKEDKDGKI